VIQVLLGHKKLDYVLLRTMSRVRQGSSSGVAFSHGR
jgi:integrase/recombinase XerD